MTFHFPPNHLFCFVCLFMLNVCLFVFVFERGCQRFMAIRGNVLKFYFIIAFFSISFCVIFTSLLHVIFNIQSPISANEVCDFLFNRTLHSKDNL